MFGTQREEERAIAGRRPVDETVFANGHGLAAVSWNLLDAPPRAGVSRVVEPAAVARPRGPEAFRYELSQPAPVGTDHANPGRSMRADERDAVAGRRPEGQAHRDRSIALEGQLPWRGSV